MQLEKNGGYTHAFRNEVEMPNIDSISRDVLLFKEM